MLYCITVMRRMNQGCRWQCFLINGFWHFSLVKNYNSKVIELHSHNWCCRLNGLCNQNFLFRESFIPKFNLIMGFWNKIFLLRTWHAAYVIVKCNSIHLHTIYCRIIILYKTGTWARVYYFKMYPVQVSQVYDIILFNKCWVELHTSLYEYRYTTAGWRSKFY